MEIFETNLAVYVAAVWNTYRRARLKLLDVLFQCGNRLHADKVPYEETKECIHLRKVTAEITNDLCASVPFLLFSNLQGHVEDRETPLSPAMALGGLMLIYPLHIASLMPLIPNIQRQWMKGRLRWIGKVMGIGQATILAEVGL